MFELSYSKLKKYCYAYISLPVLTFAIGYLRWYWMLIAVAAIAITFFFSQKEANVDRCRTNTVCINKKTMAFVFLIALIYTHLCGLNGFWYQTGDWVARNPIYHDIITYKWPIYYADKNSALAYYIGFWLVPAVPAKIVTAIFGANIGWIAGKIFLWLWGSIGIYLIFLMLFVFCKCESAKRKILAVVMFIFFSGLDVVGVWYTQTRGYLLQPDVLHLEWWHTYYQYSSLTTCVCWVFNQSIIPWVCTFLVLFEKDCKNYLLIGVSCLLCGPIPFVGLVIIMFAREIDAIILAKKEEVKWKKIFSSIFSLPNMIIICTVLPIIGCYMLTNNATGGGMYGDTADSPAITATSFYMLHQMSSFLRTYIQHGIFGFYMLEVGIYLLLIWSFHKKEVIFYAVAISLFFIPAIHIGVSNDFCMRASIPGVFVTMVWCNEQISKLVKTRLKKGLNLRMTALLLALMIGAFTPSVELFRGFYHVVKEKTIFLENMPNETLDVVDGVSYNFETSNASEQLFFKYFAKKLK